MSTMVVNVRTVKEYDVYIGRPGKWGNPFSAIPTDVPTIPVENREAAIYFYREWLRGNDLVVRRVRRKLGLEPPTIRQIRRELKGKVLGCWCKPLACHGDVLAHIADGGKL